MSSISRAQSPRPKFHTNATELKYKKNCLHYFFNEKNNFSFKSHKYTEAYEPPRTIWNNIQSIRRILLELGKSSDDRECREIESFFNKKNTDELVRAIKNNQIGSVRAILESGKVTNINRKDSYGYTPLNRACHNGNIEIVNLLLQHGADVNEEKPMDGVTPLHEACMTQNLPMAIFLLQHGADVNTKNCYGNTPLHEACKLGRGNLPMATLILKYGADVNAKDKYGDTLLYPS